MAAQAPRACRERTPTRPGRRSRLRRPPTPGSKWRRPEKTSISPVTSTSQARYARSSRTSGSRLIPRFGTHFMSDIERADLQDLVAVLAGTRSPEQGPRLRERRARALARPRPDHRQQQRSAHQPDEGPAPPRRSRSPAIGSPRATKRIASSTPSKSATRRYGRSRCT